MISRKNDGTVKMTSQNASKNLFTLGITQDGNTVNRYLTTPNPGRPAVTGPIDVPIQAVLLETRRVKIVLVKYRNFFFFIRDDFRLKQRSRSITYSQRSRAIQKFESNKIIWLETNELPAQS